MPPKVSLRNCQNLQHSWKKLSFVHERTYATGLSGAHHLFFLTVGNPKGDGLICQFNNNQRKIGRIKEVSQVLVTSQALNSAPAYGRGKPTRLESQALIDANAACLTSFPKRAHHNSEGARTQGAASQKG